MTAWIDYPADDGREHTVAGTVKVLRGVRSEQLRNERDILVYLPPGAAESRRRYPVVYMHDGQNLFDRATAFDDEWEIDHTMEDASREGLAAIIVGIPNTGGGRTDEYSPFIDRKMGGGLGDAYLSFVLETVKPLVDAEFPTDTSRAATGIFGSSMGGLISIYAFFRHPDAFGFAGAMSPALWFAQRAIFPYLATAPFVPGRLYVDVGTLEGAMELADVKKLRAALLEKGYRRNRDLMYVVERGARHNERAWGRRFRRALVFLLGAAGARRQ
jgi:predicted alpha/beta superfamily hydrolase